MPEEIHTLLSSSGYSDALRFIHDSSGNEAKYVFLASEGVMTAGLIFGIQTLHHTDLRDLLAQTLAIPLPEQSIIAAGLASIMQKDRIVVFGRSKHVQPSPEGAEHAQLCLDAWRS